MNSRHTNRVTHGALLWRVIALLAFTCALAAPAAYAQTAGGTQIQNRASATYSDGTTTYSTVSNQVTVTVANVSGLTITPDAGTNPTVVSGQNNVDFSFTVTNTSNFATQVRFLSLGGSIQVFGPGTIQAAVVDADNNGFGGTDVDIKGNASNVSYPASGTVPRNGTFTVIVRVNINAAAAAGSTINVRLGDATGGAPTYDNQVVAPANLTTAKVRTESGASAPVNGESEARGDITATVQTDALLKLALNAPAGPVALGSNITYTWAVDNVGGQRAATAQTLAGAPAGSNSGVFVVAPIPVGTSFVSVTPPAGVTVLYSTSAITNDPLSPLTVWTTTPPAPLSSVTRIAYNVGASLAVGATVSNMQMVVNVSTSVNASVPIWEIGDAFARNNVSAGITDQSGDAVANKGDGNANFNEPRFGVDAVSATQGFQLPTTLTLVGNVLLGPAGQPSAVGPTNNNDDYTNKTVSPAIIAGLSSADTIASAATVDFTNTVSNTGNGNDTFRLTAPTVPAGFTVRISIDGGTTFTTVSGGGFIDLPLNFGQQANIVVRVVAPVGSAVLNSFPSVIRATSANSAASFNETIDRLYTGFLRLQKSFVIFNTTGVGAANDAVPGAEIEYTITYQNLSTSGGSGNVTLTASSIVISEDGSAAPNNWAANTTQVLTTAPSDNQGGTITDGTTNGAVTATTTFLKDSVTSLAPGLTGTFKFRRRIN